MPESSLSNIVFAGGEFAASMFDERSLERHLGRLDPKNQIRINSVGRFGYGDGGFSFFIMPERVSVDFSTHYQSKSPDEKTESVLPKNIVIIPEELIDSAKSIVSVLEPATERKAVRVSEVGINCSAIFGQQEVGLPGTEFCSSHLINPESKGLIGAESDVTPCARFKFETGKILFDVRIEPYFVSGGQNLFVAVNSLQNVADGESLSEKLLAAEKTETYIRELYDRILTGSREN